MSTDDDYDAAADMAGSIEECYRAIRERMARGGPAWVPPDFVEVLPLDDSFTGPAICFEFGEKLGGKVLAVSPEDAARIEALLGTEPTGRLIELSRSTDGTRIRIEVVRS